MAKTSTVIRDLRKLQEEWFKDDSPMAARIDAAIKEIRGYEWENGFLRRECVELAKKVGAVAATVKLTA